MGAGFSNLSCGVVEPDFPKRTFGREVRIHFI
jgi:hypothetical protein